MRTLVRSASVTGDVVLGDRGSTPGLVAGRVGELDWARSRAPSGTWPTVGSACRALDRGVDADP